MKVHVLTESDWKGRDARIYVFSDANLRMAKAHAEAFKYLDLTGLAYVDTVEVIETPKSVARFKRELRGMVKEIEEATGEVFVGVAQRLLAKGTTL